MKTDRRKAKAKQFRRYVFKITPEDMERVPWFIMVKGEVRWIARPPDVSEFVG